MTPVTNEQETVEIPMVELTRNTRGANSRAITFKAVGAFKDVVIERETKPMVDADGKPVLDEYGNQKRESLGKDAEGKLITIKEDVQEFESDGVITDIADALELCNNEEQLLLDCFAEGFNERAYDIEANKDELDEFLADMEMNDEQKAVFKRTARQLNRGTGVSVLDAADMIKAMILKKRAEALAKAQAASNQAATVPA
jgi:hypothetical protein